MTSDGEPYAVAKFRQIVSEQVTLGYLTKGGVSYSESEEMSPYERKIALDTIREILDGQKRGTQEALEKAQQENNTRRDPQSGLTMLR